MKARFWLIVVAFECLLVALLLPASGGRSAASQDGLPETEPMLRNAVRHYRQASFDFERRRLDLLQQNTETMPGNRLRVYSRNWLSARQEMETAEREVISALAARAAEQEVR